MAIKIIQSHRLSLNNITDIKSLYQRCNQHDGTSYAFDLEEDFQNDGDVNTFLLYRDNRLAATLNIFAPTKAEAEITALTLPEERQRGHFNKLLKLAKIEIQRRGIPSILFVCDSCSSEAIAVMQHRVVNYEFSEFLMEYNGSSAKAPKPKADITIEKATLSHKESLIEINLQAFQSTEEDAREIIEEFFSSSKRTLFSILLHSNVIGMIGVYDETTRKYIHGFCIDRNYRNQGIGQSVLYEIVNRYRGEHKPLVLEVQTQNRNALKVYQKVGFDIKAEFQYYRESV